MLETKRVIFITGGAGYVGEMLCDQLAKCADVERIITVDKENQSDFSKQIPKLTYIKHNLADSGWQEIVAAFKPDTVIHTAWQIRALYGQAKQEWQWNVDGSQAVFDFAFTEPWVKRLVHFSTAASYSARPSNTLDHYFTEAEGLRDDRYIYAHEKKVVEDNLRAKYEASLAAGAHTPQITVLRPAAITGPRGRYLRIRFGLQSALAGNLKGSLVNRLVTTLTALFPATKGWVRQFIHEDDVVDLITHFTFADLPWSYEVFNGTPQGAPVYPEDMAAVVHKRILPIHPWLVRIAFFIFWHLTRGKIPTAPGSWRFYAYPILLSGDKLAEVYRCRYDSKSALQYTAGRYEQFVPTAWRRPAPAGKPLISD